MHGSNLLHPAKILEIVDVAVDVYGLTGNRERVNKHSSHLRYPSQQAVPVISRAEEGADAYGITG
ncbi:MAG TPA: hypothetical protein VK435_04565 [Thermodesulfovibrionales bacterium]|nr:hypothetical protein [Thermodesulfovibrionales bacterium]